MAMTFYGIEYAYGRTVVNNGARADRVVSFTSRRLRDAWVADGNAYDGPGARDVLPARKVTGRDVEDGDAEAWAALAQARVQNNPELAKFTSVLIGYDWGTNTHAQWVATATEKEIVSWAKNVSE